MNAIDTFVLYKFLRKLALPFKEWKMYELGIIDEHGNFLQDKETRSEKQLSSYSYLDILVLNLKKLLAKIPGGSTRIATFAAALYLMRERNAIHSHQAMESATENFNLDRMLSEARLILEEDGGVPANNVGDGQIADKKQGLPYKVNGKNVLKRKQNENIQ